MNVAYAVERRGATQYLVRFSWKRAWRWFSVKREVVDSEIIPADALLCLGCFGDTGGWRSKFSAYI